jgi:hypothetical protein
MDGIDLELHDGQMFRLPEPLPGLGEFVKQVWRKFKVGGCTCTLGHVQLIIPKSWEKGEDITVVTWPDVDDACPEHRPGGTLTSNRRVND